MTAQRHPLFCEADFADRALARLYPSVRDAPEDADHSDHAIAGMRPDAATLAAARPAAVLIPVLARPEGMTVLMTQRSSSLRQHSGQIAFPGGKVDATDADPLAAALREAEEEVGLSANHARPLGYLAPYFSSTGFRITPVVALVAPEARFAPNTEEVAEIFETPLDFLMNPDNHQTHEREWKGQMRRYFAMPHEDRYIWGVTAGIIRMLWLRLYAPHPS